MVTLVNRAKVATATTGTGTITLGSAESGYQTFASAGVVDTDVVRYTIEDGTAWEIGSGTYTATGTTLTRTLDESSTGSLLNLSGSAVVYVTAAAEDVFQGELIAENYDGTSTLPSATGTNAISIAPLSTSTGINSVSIGSSADATGNQAFSFGVNSSASGLRGISFGSSSFTNNTDAVAIGSSAQAQSVGGLALGHDATVITGAQAVAIGDSYASGTDSFAAAIANNTSTYGATGGHSLAIGWGAKATSSQSVCIGGFYSQATDNYAVTLGGSQNTASGQYSVSIAGASNVSSGDYSSALGGQSNTASGSHSIAMGQSSSATQANSIAIGDTALSTTANLIALGGTTDTVQISGTYTLPTSDGTTGQVLTTNGAGAVTFADAGGGGTAQELYAENPVTFNSPSATGNNSVAVGDGASATATSTIALGRSASATANYAFSVGFGAVASGTSSISLGQGTDATAGQSTAIGMNSSSQGSQAVTGAGAMALGGSYASGTDSFAAAIANNTSSYGATGANSVAIGGTNKATGTGGLALGRNAISTAQDAVSIGLQCTADATNSIALGAYSSTKGIKGRIAFSGVSSNYQQGTFVLAKQTADATPSVLTYNTAGASTDNQIILPNNSAYAFHGTIVARQQASTGTACAAWKVEGLIRREGSAGTTVLVNSATTVLDNTPAWGMALSADTTNGGLKIEVTGAAATNIRWVATINTSEVTY